MIHIKFIEIVLKAAISYTNVMGLLLFLQI